MHCIWAALGVVCALDVGCTWCCTCSSDQTTPHEPSVGAGASQETRLGRHGETQPEERYTLLQGESLQIGGKQARGSMPSKCFLCGVAMGDGVGEGRRAKTVR